MIEYPTVGPSDGGCHICWMDEERGLLVKDESGNGWVHPMCLDEFEVESIKEYESEYIDPVNDDGDSKTFVWGQGWITKESSDSA